MNMRKDFKILIIGVIAGWMLVRFGPVLTSGSSSRDITSLLAQQEGSTIILRDIIHGKFFCIGQPEAGLVVSIKMVFGDFRTDNKADEDSPGVWTIAAIDPAAKNLSVYWVNENQIELKDINSIMCGQNLELLATRSEDGGMKQVAPSNVEIRQLGGYSRIEGRQG